MRNLSLQQLVSLDGYILEEGSEFWHWHGGVTFVRSLARLGVVDEYRLYVYPITIGSGRSPFAGIEAFRPLRLVSSRAFPCGGVELTYARHGERA